MELAILTIFCTSFLVALSGALMPGPLLTVTISESTRRGAMTGPLLIFGHSILELALVTLLISGLAPFFVRNDVFIFISYVGGAMLLFMGVSMLRALSGLTMVREGEQTQSRSLVLAGVILSAINPYFLIWWGSIGTGYIIHSLQFGILGVIAFFSGHIIADLAWYSFISFAIAKGRHLFNDRVYKKLIGGCAIFLILFSGWFFYSGTLKMIS
ncbi:LysE family transporter [Desulforhopalus sp. IMCC35007]|uniref:LysE family transporter n=1 Tax=Desulforhopalus sp. IMCC35007 TaxID=2569543 RepID=UPI0010AE3A75|nr:LysE family transporter [Desulforhopalus sp. IMCC35007]TKB10692.1 lysine transporter LysE [Desulforhopalus sp. IMCC35007]